MEKTKHNIVHDIKTIIKRQDGKSYAFPVGTTFKFYEYGVKKKTLVINMYVEKDVLYITTYTQNNGAIREKLSDFDIDEVREIYNFVKNI